MPNGSCSEKGKTRFCTVLGGGLQIICFIFTPKKTWGNGIQFDFRIFYPTELKPPTNVKISPCFQLMTFVGGNDFGELMEAFPQGMNSGMNSVGDDFGGQKPRKTRDTVDGNQESGVKTS